MLDPVLRPTCLNLIYCPSLIELPWGGLVSIHDTCPRRDAGGNQQRERMAASARSSRAHRGYSSAMAIHLPVYQGAEPAKGNSGKTYHHGRGPRHMDQPSFLRTRGENSRSGYWSARRETCLGTQQTETNREKQGISQCHATHLEPGSHR